MSNPDKKPSWRNETSRLFKLAGPLIVNNLGIAGMQAADTIMSGQIGAATMAAVAVGVVRARAGGVGRPAELLGPQLVERLPLIVLGRHREVRVRQADVVDAGVRDDQGALPVRGSHPAR